MFVFIRLSVYRVYRYPKIVYWPKTVITKWPKRGRGHRPKSEKRILTESGSARQPVSAVRFHFDGNVVECPHSSSTRPKTDVDPRPEWAPALSNTRGIASVNVLKRRFESIRSIRRGVTLRTATYVLSRKNTNTTGRVGFFFSARSLLTVPERRWA